MRYRRTLVVVGLVAVVVGACRSQDQPGPPPAPAPAQPDWQVVARRLGAELRDAQAVAAGADVRDSNLPLAALELEKLQVRLRDNFKGPAWEELQETSEKTFEAALQRLRTGQVACAGETGGKTQLGFLERAYLCRTDGSPQPYFVRLPDDYDPAKRWPLVLFLHGYVPDTSKVDPWVLPPNQWKMASDRGLILVMPHGRRNSDFLGIGEVDVLRVIEEVRRWYQVDPDRIFMTGCSMGGYGGWALGLRHPDMFAGLALMAGQTDFFVWENRDRTECAFKSWCIVQNNPIDLAVNALHLPSLVQHGEQDRLVPTVHSQIMVPVLEKLGYQVEYLEYKGKSHYIYWEDEPFEKMFDWCKDKRRDPAPAKVRYKTFTTRCGQCYWIDIRRFQRWGPAGEVDAAVADGRIDVKAANVAELWLDLPAKLLPEAGLPLRVNGQDAGRVARGAHRVMLDADGRPSPAVPGTPPPERPRTGPAREAFNGPFKVCYTTGGAGAEQNRSRAERFGGVWYAFAEAVLPPPSPDRELSAEDVKSHNLVVFGEPSTARLAGIDDPAAALPAGIRIAPGDYTIGPYHLKGERLGLYFLQPHPLDPQRLILWCSGVEYGAGLPVNHQFDLLPDLLVYNDEIGPDSANSYLLGGFLTQDGRLDPLTLDRAPGVKAEP
ncbi:MAG: prolyl oligopeptidase family serine peptidase [Armatimonadetes bacterium]|nr:prolyl oligopeptidase family serine peptidase [Armatimonadota bacterium]